MEVNTSRMVSLNGTNYHIWRRKMEDLLYCKDYYLPIQGYSAKPEKMSDDEWKLLNRKVVGYIRQWIDDNVINHVFDEDSASSLWANLETLYGRRTSMNKSYLVKKLVSTKYRDGTPILDHMNEIQGILNQLGSMKINFDDELQALFLFGSLSDSWDNLALTVSNSAPDGVVGMSLVKSALMREEMRRTSLDSSPDSEALVVENRGRSQNRGPNHGGMSRNKSRPKKNDGTSEEQKVQHLMHCEQPEIANV